jgi:hypothetical protein
MEVLPNKLAFRQDFAGYFDFLLPVIGTPELHIYLFVTWEVDSWPTSSHTSALHPNTRERNKSYTAKEINHFSVFLRFDIS